MWDAYNEWQNFEPYEEEPPPAPVTDRAAPGLTAAEEEMIRQVRQNVAAPATPTGESSQLDAEVIGPLAEQLTAEGHELPPHWTYSINPDGSIGEPLPPEELAGGAGALPGMPETGHPGSARGSRYDFERLGLIGGDDGEAPPPITIDGQPNPAYQEYLTQMLGAESSGHVWGNQVQPATATPGSSLGGQNPWEHPTPTTAPTPGSSLGGQNPWDRMTPPPSDAQWVTDVPPPVSIEAAVAQLLTPQTSARQPGGIGHRLEVGSPPPVTIGGEPNPEYQDYLDRYTANQQTPQTAARQPGDASHLAELPREMIGDWLVNNMLGGMDTGETEERYDPLSSAGTGERVRRTPESEARRPGEASHRTEVEGGALHQRFRRSVLDANKERVRFGQERQNIYGKAWGQALRAVYNAQQSGATPMQQAYAQRMQSIQNAGIPLGSSPRVVSY